MLENDVEAINFKIGCGITQVKGATFNQVNMVVVYSEYTLIIMPYIIFRARCLKVRLLFSNVFY